MPVVKRIREEMLKAAKSSDRIRLSTTRLLIAAIKNREIDLKRTLREEEVYQVIGTMIRQRRESIEQFRLGHREDLADKEEKELSILSSFLPPKIPIDELKNIVGEIIAEINAVGVKDMGKVMKELMKRVAGRVDGKTASDIVRELLTAE